jgi:hypothetical protein
MTVHLGVKSDPIESRYSFEWLFDLMSGCGVHRLQMGSSFPVFFAADDHFRGLRRAAESRGIRITSMFSSHRELGFANVDPLLDDATRRGWERMIHVASLVGAESFGSNACLVLRDQPRSREPGLRKFSEHMKGLLAVAREAGLQALTLEPMSSLYELPSTPEEIRQVMREMDEFHAAHASTTVPLQLCGTSPTASPTRTGRWCTTTGACSKWKSPGCGSSTSRTPTPSSIPPSDSAPRRGRKASWTSCALRR